MSKKITTFGLAACLILAMSGSLAFAQESTEWVAKFNARLAAGEFDPAETELKQLLAKHPDNDDMRFALGATQSIRAVEHACQSLAKCGVRTQALWMFNFLIQPPLPRIDTPGTGEVTLDRIRAIVQRFVDDLEEADQTLAAIRGDKADLPLRVSQIRLDLDGQNGATDHETLGRLLRSIDRNLERNAWIEDLVIDFDRADAYWLRGYIHILMAGGEWMLAHDMSELFDRVGRLIFPTAKTPYEFVGKYDSDFSMQSVTDLIAVIHLTHFPVIEPERMRRALAHLQETSRQSRLMWKSILSETDDHREWIPSPKQSGVVPGVFINPQMIDVWHSFLDEIDALLAGKKLAPFWRDAGGKGVNINRVFTEPRTFDLVLWIQGTDAAPYLEDGELTSEATWQRIRQIFHGDFVFYAMYFN